MNLNQQNGWIAVSDRLPELDTPVWAGWFNTKGKFVYGLFVRFKEGGEWFFAQCSQTQSWNDFGDRDLDDDYSHLTHWQPLPEPPVL